MLKNNFCCYFWYAGFTNISIGVSLSIKPLNLEFHIPFGFLKIGIERVAITKPCNWDEVKKRQFGYGKSY